MPCFRRCPSSRLAAACPRLFQFGSAAAEDTQDAGLSVASRASSTAYNKMLEPKFAVDIASKRDDEVTRLR